jgi:predicted phage-related endonuclease
MSAPPRRIGGSDIAKLLGLSKYGGPFEVYQRIVEGIEEPWNPLMERGAAMEPVLRAHAQRMLGLELEDLPTDYIDSPEHPFARAQIDDLARLGGMPVVAEYKSKNRFARGFGRNEDGDMVPEDIHAQVTWQMLCTGRELAIVVVGFGEDTEDGGFDLHNIATFEVQRDAQFEAYCVHVAKDFWERHVLPCVPPVPTRQKRRKAAHV